MFNPRCLWCLGTHGTPGAGTRTAHVPCLALREQAALCLWYVQHAGGRYALPVRTVQYGGLGTHVSAHAARQHQERFVGGREHSLLLLRVEVAGVGRDGAEGHRRWRVGPGRRQDLRCRCRCRWRWGRSPRHRAVQAAWLHGSELDQDDLPALCTLLEGRRSRWPRRPLRSIERWQAHLRLRRLLRRRSLGLRRGRVQLGAALGAELGGGRALRAALPARESHHKRSNLPANSRTEASHGTRLHKNVR